MPSTGEILIDLLARAGVTTVFGIPGVHTLELYRGLSDSPIRHIAPRHEQGAAFMADGWARVSGEPGVCILIGGPGLTNAITPIAQAYHDSIPLLVISGAVPAAQRDLGEIHDLPDQEGLLAKVTAFSETISDPAQLPAALDRALQVFRSARPRPVHLGLPLDVLKVEAESPDWIPAAPAPPVADDASIARAAALLGAARRPLVLVGGGARDAGAEALAVARQLDAPVGLTINARGTVPDDDPLCLGSALSFEPVGALLRDADATLLIGSQFSDLELWGLSEPLERLAGLVRIDIDAAQLNRRWTPEVGLHGDATASLRALLAQLPPAPRSHDAAGRVATARAHLAPPEEVTRFAPMLEALDAVLPADRIVAGDSTQPVYAANHIMPAFAPRSWLMPIGYGCLGCALPMAIGAKLAAPERAVLAIAGDGGVLFTIQELATARDLGLPVVTIVYDHRGYGEIRDAMDGAGVPHIATDGVTHDLLAICAGFGVAAERAVTVEQLADAVKRGLEADGPTVIEYSA
jgi:acetolactate synthase-1/2/3 large subunit